MFGEFWVLGNGMDTAFDTDYFIIGSGFGGSVSAMRLTEKGYRVMVAEQGQWFTPQNMPKSTRQIRRYLWLPLLSCRGFFAMRLFKHMLVLHGNAVGGGSIVYANTMLIPKATIWDNGSWAQLQNWHDIMPIHYQSARAMLGVTVNPILADADLTLKNINTFAGVKDSFYPTEVAIYFGDDDEYAHPKVQQDPYFQGRGRAREACVGCGGCMVACRFLAKNSLDFNYLDFAQKQGAAILSETKVLKIEALGAAQDGSSGYRVTCKMHGQKISSYTALNVIVSAGSLGTQQLLFAMKDQGYLPNISSCLGYNVFTNAESLIGIRFPNTDKDFSKGIAIGSGMYLDDGTHIEATRFPEGSNIAGLLGTMMNYTESGRMSFLKWSLTLLGQAILHPIVYWRTFRPKNIAKESLIFLCMQAIPQPLQMVWRRRRFMPWKKALATVGSPIPSHIPSATKVALEAAKRFNGTAFNGVSDVFLNIPTTAHCMGGAALASNENEGVCDVQHRVFGYQGLYIVDGANISTNLGVNPSLTICALAEAAMSHIPSKAQ